MGQEGDMRRDDRVLRSGKRFGFEWIVRNNGMGFRCGYIRIPDWHHWYGKVKFEGVDVHGGITYAGAGHNERDDEFWIGFHCGNAYDGVDLSLAFDSEQFRDLQSMLGIRGRAGWKIKDDDYVQKECEGVCGHMAEAALAEIIKGEGSEAEAFAAAIRNNWEDDAPRLVFADWLEERGDERHAHIRAMCRTS